MFKIVILLSLVSCANIKKQVSSVQNKVTAPVQKVEPFKVAWVKDLDPVYNTGNLPIGTSSPYVFDDILYMGDLRGDMKAYDLENGRVIWQANEKKPIQSQVNKFGDNIFYGSKTGRLYSRHYLTGKLNYAIDLGSPVESQPVFTNGRIVLHLRNHTVITLDAQTGKIFWKYRRSIPYTTTLQRVSQVLPFDDMMIVGFADGYLVSLSLSEGVVNWEQKISTGLKFVDVDVTPFYFNGFIVAGSAAGPMRMINPQNGVIERNIEFFQSHTPIVDDNHMIVGSVFGEVVRVDKFGKVLKKRKFTNDGISSIVEWKGGYAVTTMGNYLFLIDKEDLKVKSKFHFGSDQSAVFGSLVKFDDYLTVYSSRNRLYVFK